MTLPPRHRTRNSNPGGLRPSTLPLGHGGSPQYWVLRLDGEKHICLFQTAATGKQTPNVKGSGANHYPRAPALMAHNVLLWRILTHKQCSTHLKSITALTLWPPNYSIWIFTHLKLCLANAIHNFKWVKIIMIWQNGGQLFSNFAGWCHILSLTYLKCGK